MTPLSQAAADVLAERERQISEEDWTPQHDSIHSGGQMARAASCYALQRDEAAFYPAPTHEDAGWYRPEEHVPQNWPWARSWWKPTTYRRNLVKAGALILAEIERLDRAAPRHGRGARD